MNRTLTIVGLFLLLSACGFHLRGAIPLPPTVQALAVEGVEENGPLWRALRDALPRAGAHLVPPADADAVLVVRRDGFTRRVLSVDAQGRAQEYELQYQLDYGLRDREGQWRLSERHLRVVRQYRFDPDAVLAKDEEERRLRAEMRRLAVGRLLRQVALALSAEAGNAPAP